MGAMETSSIEGHQHFILTFLNPPIDNTKLGGYPQGMMFHGVMSGPEFLRSNIKRSHIRYLNVLIPTLQFGIISKIVRFGYLLHNFKKSTIQNHDPKDEVPKGGRPCRAKMRWYGATDAGLRDVRDNIRLW